MLHISSTPRRLFTTIFTKLPHCVALGALDRRDALEEAISFLNEKTTLLVLGKGHEKHQEIGDRILDFDDVVVIKDILGKR